MGLHKSNFCPITSLKMWGDDWGWLESPLVVANNAIDILYRVFGAVPAAEVDEPEFSIFAGFPRRTEAARQAYLPLSYEAVRQPPNVGFHNAPVPEEVMDEVRQMLVPEDAEEDARREDAVDAWREDAVDAAEAAAAAYEAVVTRLVDDVSRNFQPEGAMHTGDGDDGWARDSHTPTRKHIQCLIEQALSRQMLLQMVPTEDQFIDLMYVVYSCSRMRLDGGVAVNE